MTTRERMIAALNRLCKWRMLLTGRWLGTVPNDDPVAESVRDIQDVRLILRCEMSAVTALLLRKNVFTVEELQEAIIAEAEEADKDWQKTFPGFKSTDLGLVTTDTKLAAKTMAHWPR